MTAREEQRLTVLGPPVLQHGRHSVPFAAERRFQLLAYLACRDGWVPREALAALFWPDRDSATARRNLRGILFDLRKAPWLGGFTLEGDSVRWQVACDEREFRERYAAKDWAGAIAVVSGEFLAGMELNAPEPFVDWLRFERERHVALWREAVTRRLTELDDAPAAAIDVAQAALALDPHNESLMAALVAALSAQGRAAEALRSYRAFAERLAADAGVAPSAALRVAAERVASHAAVPPVTRTAHAAALVGRRAELKEVVALQKGNDCRWVTLLGPGGVGKSSLARAAAAALAPEFPQGVAWVELRDLESVPQMVARMAEAFGVTLAGAADPWPPLVRALGDRRALAVLDNAEHLPGTGAACERLLAQCPGLRLVVTSRARLGGAGEWVFPLSGLPVPDDDETDPDVLLAFDAMQLFDVRARAVAPHFALRAHAPVVRDVVRAVDGLPLAIELAAAGLRMLPVDAVRDNLAAAFALAGGTLEASFDHSWQRLAARERDTLAGLAVFAGEFTAAGARQVADASLPVLGALVDQSLVRASDGRFSLHPLVREFALQRLTDADATRARHAGYFVQLLAHRGTLPTRERVQEVDACLPDAVAAFRFACTNAPALAGRIAGPLAQAMDETGRWSEALALFEQAQLDGGPAAAAARAEIARCISLFRYRRGDFDVAERRARESLRGAIALRSLRGVDMCLNLIGGALRQRGQFDEARRYFERGRRHATAAKDRALACRIGNNLASIEMATGHVDRAVALCEAQLAAEREGDDPLTRAMTRLMLANARNASGELALAQRRYEEGLALAEQHGLATVRPFFLQALGNCHRDQGHLDLAQEYYRKTLDGPAEGRELHVEASVHLGLARIAIARRDYAAARPPLVAALALAIRMGAPSWQIAVIARWGELYARSGDVARGGALLAFAAANRDADATQREEWRALLHAVAAEDERSRCETAAAALDLAEVVTELAAETG